MKRNPDPNPIQRAQDGAYWVMLPRRMGLGRYAWSFGPFRGDGAYEVAGMVSGGHPEIDESGHYVTIRRGPALSPPRIGPFDRHAQAAAVLGRLVRAVPVPAPPKQHRPVRSSETYTEKLTGKQTLTMRAPLEPRESDAIRDAAGAFAELGYGKREALALAREAAAQTKPNAGTEEIMRIGFRLAQSSANPVYRSACPYCHRSITVPKRHAVWNCRYCGATLGKVEEG